MSYRLGPVWGEKDAPGRAEHEAEPKLEVLSEPWCYINEYNKNILLRFENSTILECSGDRIHYKWYIIH